LGNALYTLYDQPPRVCHCISIFQAKYVPNDEITKKSHQTFWVENEHFGRYGSEMIFGFPQTQGQKDISQSSA